MNFTTIIPTDLITPLGAYLRLREEAPASFLLESVEHGRLGRYSWVGAGSKIVDLAGAEGRAEPVVGTARMHGDPESNDAGICSSIAALK